MIKGSQNTPLLLQEGELINLEDLVPKSPDFMVRSLDNYEPKSLTLLINAVANELRLAHLSDADRKELDVWCYRLRDARKVAISNSVNSQKPNRHK